MGRRGRRAAGRPCPALAFVAEGEEGPEAAADYTIGSNLVRIESNAQAAGGRDGRAGGALHRLARAAGAGAGAARGRAAAALWAAASAAGVPRLRLRTEGDEALAAAAEAAGRAAEAARAGGRPPVAGDVERALAASRDRLAPPASPAAGRPASPLPEGVNLLELSDEEIAAYRAGAAAAGAPPTPGAASGPDRACSAAGGSLAVLAHFAAAPACRASEACRARNLHGSGPWLDVPLAEEGEGEGEASRGLASGPGAGAGRALGPARALGGAAVLLEAPPRGPPCARPGARRPSSAAAPCP
eukprot:tig00000113_g5660.t1